MDLNARYAASKGQYEHSLNELHTYIFWLGWVRLLVFSLAAVGFYLFFKSEFQSGWIIASIGMLVFFLFLVKHNERQLNQREILRQLIRINENELQVLQYQPSRWEDGTAFQTEESYLHDLDVFGARSIFHLLNRTATSLGETRLADLLRHPFTDVQIIENQQQAIQELADLLGFRQLFFAQALRTRSNPLHAASLQAWVESPLEFYESNYIRTVRILMPALTLSALLWGIFSFQFSFFIFLFILNFVVVGRYGLKINNIHAAVSRNTASLGILAELFRLVNTQNFKSTSLQKIHSETLEANRALQQLDRLANFFDQRLNMVAYALMTGLAVYDLQCVFLLERWKAAYRDKVSSWLNAIGELEMLNSLATFYFNNPDYTFPYLKEGNPFIEAKGMTHPLIPAFERVANDFEIGKKEKLYIVTGSNMSGKSTFLRTLGVNVLLARCGAPVCATQFACTAMDIHTSLRQSDSLQDHVSTFFAELRRLQSILIQLEESPNALVLLDEVLRGTNSDDKLYGSQQLVQRLLGLHSIALLATHDIELSKMDQAFPGKLGNLCFESIIENEHLYFDYKLKPGTAKNRNATFLMKQMGIINT